MQKHSRFLILFPALALGILLGSQSTVNVYLLIFFGATLLLWLYASYKNMSTHKIHWLVLGIGMLLLGQLSSSGKMIWSTPREGKYTGLVYSVKALTFDQRVLVRLKRSRQQVAVHLPLDANVKVGDDLIFIGTVQKPPRAANPGVFCYQEYLHRQGVFGLVYPDSFTVHSPTRVPFLRRVRQKARKNLQAQLVDPGLVQALVLGERDGLTTERRDLWRELGISHLLAISGMHIGLLALLFGWLVHRLPLPMVLRVLLTQLFLLGYIVLAGTGPSAWRAFLVGLLASYGNLKKKKIDPLHLWAFIGWLLLLGQPTLVFEPGFTLSFAASGGIILWGKTLNFRFRSKVLAYVANSLIISIIAQLSLAPLLVYYFQEIALLGPLSTLVFLPFVIVLLVGGLAVALGLGSFGLGALLNQIMGIVESLERLLHPLAWQWVPKQLSLGQIVLWWLFFVYAGWCLRKPRVINPARTLDRLVWIFVLLIVLTSLPPFFFMPLEITAINVGQGDSYYIKTPQGKHILLDGGGDSVYWQERGRNVGLERLVPYLRYRKIERLDYVILSHPHEDHLFGLLAVLENFDVGMVIDNGHAHTSVSYQRYLELLETKEIPYFIASAGDTIKLGTNLTLKVLHPQDVLEEIPSAFNNNSLLLRLDYGGISALFTGDLEKDMLYDLAHDPDFDLRAQWVKVPHHGSKSSFLEDFYFRVRPRWATISVGPNSFGHPHQEVVEFFDQNKITWATTTDGPVSFFIWWGFWGRLKSTQT